MDKEIPRKIEVLEGLYKISQNYSFIDDVADIYGNLTKLISRLIGGRGCVIILLDQEKNQLRAQAPGYNVSHELINDWVVDLKGGMVGELLVKRGGYYLSNDAFNDPKLDTDFMKKHKLIRVLNVPMITSRGPLGIVSVFNKPREFTDDDAKILSIWANQAAITIENFHFLKKIREYSEQLEESNRLMDLFSDIMRHDLQNSVTVVKGISRIMGDDETQPEKRRQLSMIKRNAEKMEELIDASSKLSRLAGKEKLDFVERDINAMFRGVVKDFEQLIKEEGIKVDYRAKGKRLASVHATIEDVFTNLLSNAIKYSPRKSRVTIEILDEWGHWRIAVADQGEGIPDEYKEGIFLRFTRAHKGGVNGSGLGLAIVKRIVELHNGKVWVEDNTPRGSIFYVQLPKGE